MSELNHDRIKLLLAMNAPIVFTAFSNTKFEHAAEITSKELSKKLDAFYNHYYKYNHQIYSDTVIFLNAKINGKDYTYDLKIKDFAQKSFISRMMFARAFAHFVIGVPENDIKNNPFYSLFVKEENNHEYKILGKQANTIIVDNMETLDLATLEEKSIASQNTSK